MATDYLTSSSIRSVITGSFDWIYGYEFCENKTNENKTEKSEKKNEKKSEKKMGPSCYDPQLGGHYYSVHTIIVLSKDF